MSRQGKGFYEFGPFRLNPLKRVLLQGEEIIPLTPKALSTLLALVERHGEVVEKDTLISVVWPDTFITEATLTQNIFRLRKALGEGAGDHRFIVTVPGRGYSFVAPVRWIEPEPEIPPEPPDEPPAPATGGEPVLPPDIAAPAPAAPRAAPRRSVWKLSLAAALALLAVGAVLLRQSTAPSSPSPRETSLPSAVAARAPRLKVAVLGFRNLSNRNESAWLSTALAEMFTVELGVGEKLQTLSGETVARALIDLGLGNVDNLSPQSLARIRAILGCDVVLLGSYLDLGDQAGGKVRVDLRLLDTVTGETLAVSTRTRKQAELFELVSDLGMELRQDLGSGQVPQEAAVLARAAFPVGQEAGRLYAEGLQSLRTLDALTARDRLLQATAAEPSFPLAHAALAIAWSNLGYDTRAEEESARALSLSSSLPREDRLLVEGLHEETRGNWRQAVEIYKSLWTYSPDNAEHGLQLASAQIQAGRAKDALVTLATLRRLPPPLSTDPRIDLTEAEAAGALSDFRRQETLAARAAQRGEELGARQLVAKALQSQSYAARVLGKTRESLGCIEKAREIFAATGDRSGFAESLSDTATLIRTQGNLSRARSLYEQALVIHREIGNQRGRLRTERQLGNLTAAFGDIAGAKKYLSDAVVIAEEINDPMEQAQTLANLAGIQHAEGELTAAEHSFGEILKSFQAIGSTEGMAAARLNLSTVLRDQGNLPASRSQIDLALRTLREIGHSQGTGYALLHLGVLLVDQGDLDGALAAFHELDEMARAAGLESLRADACTGLALVQRLQGNLAAAHKNQLESLTIREKSSDHNDETESRLALALLALEEGDAQSAEREARAAVEQFHALHFRDSEGLARATLGRALQAQGRSAAAEQAVREALAITEKSENRWTRLAVLNAAGRIAVESGRSDEARSRLSTVRDQARQLGLWIQRLEATLALGQLEMQHGDPRLGRLLLEALRREATEKKYFLIARRAAALL
jgi:DNA-binding winged helix-turn-helix (wHTH) protein/tetratricopeptide (TPR) repeat protein